MRRLPRKSLSSVHTFDTFRVHTRKEIRPPAGSHVTPQCPTPRCHGSNTRTASAAATSVLCARVRYLGLSSDGALQKLTTGICSVAGRPCSEGARNGLGCRRGERSGELSPRPRRSGERGARDTEFGGSSPPPSSSSRIDGSFFTRPPLLSQSTCGPSESL